MNLIPEQQINLWMVNCLFLGAMPELIKTKAFNKLHQED